MQCKKIVTPLLVSHAQHGARTALLIGFASGWHDQARCSRYGTIVESEGPVSALLLSQVLPDAVVIPLFSANCDAISDILTLSSLGYSGRCFVLAPPLPNTKMVLTELRQHAAGLRIHLVNTPALHTPAKA